MRRENASPIRYVSVVPPRFSKCIVVVWELVWLVGLKLQNHNTPYLHRPRHRRLHRCESAHRGMYRPALSVQLRFLLRRGVVQNHSHIYLSLGAAGENRYQKLKKLISAPSWRRPSNQRHAHSYEPNK